MLKVSPAEHASSKVTVKTIEIADVELGPCVEIRNDIMGNLLQPES